MAIHERDWYRNAPRRSPFSASTTVTRLIVVNVVIFIIQIMLRNSRSWDPVFGGLGLNPGDVIGKFMVWQLVTSMFLHGGPLHLLFNMYVLYMFGRTVEMRLGKWIFFRFYMLSGVVASLVYVVLGKFTGLSSTAVGASGAIMGVLVYFTMLAPNTRVLFLFFFPMRMIWVTTLIVGLDLYMFLVGAGSNIAHTAHLGGAVFGYLYYRYAHRVDRLFLNLEIRSTTRKKERKVRDLEALQRDVDRLLEKVHAKGLDGLTEKERDFLRDASRRLREQGR